MTGVIAWFARNRVAANLIMFGIVAGGLMTLPTLRQEVFPEIEADVVNVSVVYRGAAPEEVEEAICVRIEESIRGVTGVKRLTAIAREGVGVVSAELLEDVDARRVLDEIKNQVDAIDTFPEEAEKPIVEQLVPRRQVINVAVSGPADERTLKRLGQQVRDELAALPGITQTVLTNVRPWEISIEVSEQALRRHGLTFDEVVAAVRRSSLDLPGGSLKTAGGEILLRAKGQAYRGPQFAKLVLLSRPDGSRLSLGDVAQVVDGFEETDNRARFDGEPAVLVQVFRVGQQNALDVAEAVKRYVAEAQPRMPAGIELTVWADDSQLLKARRDTLLRNAAQGFALVMALLALFLRLRLALWVGIGVPISFLGALWLMPVFDASINMVTLFAFIVVLGILVDDAIVTGENIHTHQERDPDRLRAAIRGAQEIALPVTFGVLTTVAAFVPMLLLPGTLGKVFRMIPIVVIAALTFSLIESKLVLPAHLGHGREHGEGRLANPISRGWKRLQSRFAAGLDRFIERVYGPLLEATLRWRYLTAATAVAVLLLAVGWAAGGWIRFTFFPQVEGDNVVALVTLPEGTPVQTSEAAVRRLEASFARVRAELDHGRDPEDPSAVQHVLASVGEQPYRLRQASGPGEYAASLSGGAHLGEVNAELVPAERRPLTSVEVARRWRELTGAIPDAEELVFTSSIFGAGDPIDVQLRSPDLDELRAAASALQARLAEYPGVFDVTDSFRGGKQELELQILPSAEALGLSLADLARQVRQAFYGDEAQRIQRGRDDVRVMVRYPAAERRSLADLEHMRIRLPDGTAVPFGEVARAELGRGFSTIRRTDGQRVIDVTADVDLSRANANEILADAKASVLPEILSAHPRVSYSLEGEQREQRETLVDLGRGYALALIAIFTLLAVPLRSYVQPLVIMSAIPFGFVGALIGHILMGRDMSMVSLIGLVAASGVVVNDSLVLVNWVNERHREGTPLERAVRTAGKARFRPILLTSLTTFAGLLPMMLERSVQAQFLIPMAISLAFGVLFATTITLLLVPAGVLILDDLRALPARLLGRGVAAEPLGGP